MDDKHEAANVSAENEECGEPRRVTRREFLKFAGVTGATIGLGAGLGGLLAACGGGTTTTSAAATSTRPAAAPSTSEAAPSTSTSAATSSTPAEATTTSAAAATESGRPIKIGDVTPITGMLAAFATADKWWVEHAKAAIPQGIVAGDGKQHMVEVTLVDCQSDTNRAAQVAADLINNSKVDLISASGAPDTANPVADTAEAYGTPCLCSFVPWQAFWYGRNVDPSKGFKWTYSNSLGFEQVISVFLDMYNQVPNNHVIGLLFGNDADGQSFTAPTGPLGMLTDQGYKRIQPSLYTIGSEDFTEQISEFKKAGCDVICGNANPPDWTNFWKQAVQQGLRPKCVSVGKALLFPQTVEAIGAVAYGSLAEVGWHPTWPFKDTLTGMTCEQLAAEFEQKEGQQWNATIPMYGKFEWAIDVFKRTPNIDDKEAILQAITTTNMLTCWGPLNFTEPVDPKGMHVVKNVYKTPYGGGQWRKGTKNPWDTKAWMFDLVVCSNAEAKMTQVQSKAEPMQYS